MRCKVPIAVLSASLLIICSSATSGSPQAQASADPAPASGFPGVLTYRNDNSRTGQNLAETTLTPGNVNSNGFGKLTSYPVDGLVYAQPLFVPNVKIPHQGVHNVVYVATEHDSVFAFDADGLSASPLWQHSFLNAKSGITPIPANSEGVNSVGTEIGITSTPVISVATNTIFVAAATKNKAGVYAQRLHALNLTTGAEEFSPRLVSASIHAAGDGSKNGVLAFSPVSELQRSALLLNSNAIYIAFAAQGNGNPYHGWVFGYSSRSLGAAGTFNDSPDGAAAGISESGNGLASDASGNIFIATGNGTFDADNGGVDYGDSLIKLQSVHSKLAVADYFTPWDESALAADNLDFGSAGPMLLPDQSAGPPHLAIVGDAEGTIYVINRDNLGQFSPSGDAIVQELPTEFGEGISSAPAYFNNRLYFGSSGNPMVAFALTNGQINTDSDVLLAANTFSPPGTTPSISANGSNNGIVWAVDSSAFAASGPSILYAYDASSLNELYDSTQAGSRDVAGPAVEYTVPTVANGKVYVGTQSELDIYGLL